MAKFEVGKTYEARSICDYDCIFKFEILRRTEKSVWVRVHGDIERRAIKVQEGVEQFSPFGNYSMSPVVRAAKLW